jgi:NTP pyrophosphatase (non-canonical NTP hydrolase)
MTEEKEFEVETYENVIEKGINAACEHIHHSNSKWWHDLHTGEPIERNVGELLMLVTSELAEAMEAHRKDLMDDKLPHRKGLEVELADALIRIFDLGGGLKLDLAGAVLEKLKFNKTRKDHTLEHRRSKHGKKY